MKIKSLFAMSIKSFIVGLIVFSTMASSAYAQELLKQNYPERYTVKKGDTLWDISGLFLSEPWRWPEIWQANDQIKNPHLIYPGDVLVLTFIDGRPVLRRLGSEKLGSNGEVLKLSPSIRESDINNAIPPISPSALRPFISSPLVTDDDELSTAGYIVEGVEKRLLAGMYEDMYARGLKSADDRAYRIFRGGRKFVHPKTGELLGYEAIHVGDSRLKKFGDTSRIGITMSHMEVSLLDRLRPFNETKVLPYFQPKAHDSIDIQGYVLPAFNRALEIGHLDVIAISLGARENVQLGHVFKLVTNSEPRIDPLTKEPYLLPSEQAGLAMVFRVFDKMSYAIITDRDRVIEAGDLLVHPDAVTPTLDVEHPLNIKRDKIEKEGSKLKKWWYNKRYGKYGEIKSTDGSVKYQNRGSIEKKAASPKK